MALPAPTQLPTTGQKFVMGRAISCANCLWWSPGYASVAPTKGQCRRNPPAVYRGDNGLGAVWPMTLAHGWCGEHAVEDRV